MTKVSLKNLRKNYKALAILCGLLVLSNIAMIVVLTRRTASLDSGRRYPLIDVARNFIEQEHFIVNIQPLRERLNEIVNTEPDQTVSVYFEFLNTGANVQINNDSRFYPASLVKLPSAMVAMKKVEDGDWKLSSRLVLYDQDKDNRYGQLHQEQTGTSFTIEELLRRLLIESDNTAHNMFMRNFSSEELDELKDTIGLDDLFDEKSEISAKEYSRLFRSLYNSSFLKREGSQHILDLLTKTQFDNMLPSGMPADVLFAHKIGEDDNQRNYLDSGIVYLQNRPYLLTVMVKQHDQPAAEQIMKRISEAAHGYVNEYER